jgi:hypothetical protein
MICQPQEHEWAKRVRKVCDRIASHAYEHVDLAIYQIHLHATRDHLKGVLKKKDVPDIANRLIAIYPPVEKSSIPKVDSAYLPELVKGFLAGSDVFQVLWMYNGNIQFMQSVLFRSRFAIDRCGEKRMYKFVETYGFSDYDAGHKMWLETLHNPGVVVFYEARAYRQDLKSIVMQKVKMVSVVIDYCHIITASIVV